MLETRDLSVSIEGKRILRNVNLSIGRGETVVLLGPNGSGKTSFLMTIMGMPHYRVDSGNILFKGEEITSPASASMNAQDSGSAWFSSTLPRFGACG